MGDSANVTGWLDKYGPMGCALIVVCFVLLLIVVKLMPAIMESYGKRLDSITKSLHRFIDVLTTRMEAQDQRHTARHGEIMDRLGSMDDKIDRLHFPKNDEARKSDGT